VPPNKDDAWFHKQGVAPPERIQHDLTPDDIQERVQSINPKNYRAEGDRLIADTDVGTLVQYIPTTHIFTGTDENGLPTFRKL
jgi:hypothetical protein